MNDELKRVLALQDKKWEVIYSFGENGSVFMGEKQYKKFLETAKEAEKLGKERHFYLKDGRSVSTNFKVTRLNPEWRDPKTTKAKEMFYRLQRDFTERRNRGEKISWEEYLSQHKDANKKELDDFLQRLEE